MTTYSIEKAEFAGKLKDGIPYFGYISDVKDFLDFLQEQEYVTFTTRFENDNNRFLVYKIHKDFSYTGDWIMDPTQTLTHRVGKDGNLLLDFNYRVKGHRTVVQ